jgi:phosphoethanolamine N-methyltransferase
MTISNEVGGKAQYAEESTRRYEVVFGQDFLSTGGLATTKPLCDAMGLQPGQRVLDVGCGLGGGAFRMAREYGAEVTCLDLEPDLVASAERRANEYGIDGCEFLVGDVLETPTADASFDWFHSRDAFLHIADKAKLFQRAFALLKPGGRVFVTDYGRGPEPMSNEFAAYVDASGYNLLDPEAYASPIEQAGFVDVRVEDCTASFIDILHCDLARMADPATDLSGEDRAYLIGRWQLKERACRAGDMRWWHVHAVRPD